MGMRRSILSVAMVSFAGLAGVPRARAAAVEAVYVVKAVGSQLPIGSAAQQSLTEESLTAYEVGYTGTIQERTSIGVAF